MEFALGKALEQVKMLEPLAPAGSAQPSAGLSFGNEMARALHEVRTTQGAAQNEIQAFLNGERSDLHQVAMAVQKAELQFETMLEFRNKFLQAYQEMMRM